MNNIRILNTDYIPSSRTIETVLVSNENFERVFFIFDYEGYSFRLFDSILNLLNFFQDNETESDFYFETEDQKDSFLMNFELKNNERQIE
ncbi:MAG: hypothetical protein KGZ71_12785 [Desulfobulbaceae bacterium]|nr:hypothetical protein [Desulfobulbaceae bacterium]